MTGYVRFRKIKPCKGYKDAENKAALRLSKITAGRLLENGKYAAVVRFRLLPFLIPAAAFLLVLGILKGITADAMVREEETSEYIFEPEPEPVTERGTENIYAGLYISVPGYTDCVLSEGQRGLSLFNPPENECLLQYSIYIRDSLVASTGLLEAGEYGSVDFYDRLAPGRYTAELIAKAYSRDGKTEFNSVSQQITLQRD